jgi:hypothetical protein
LAASGRVDHFVLQREPETSLLSWDTIPKARQDPLHKCFDRLMLNVELSCCISKCAYQRVQSLYNPYLGASDRESREPEDVGLPCPASKGRLGTTRQYASSRRQAELFFTTLQSPSN